jgi:hypothetical protein
MPGEWTALTPGVELLGRRLLGTGVALGIGAASGERLHKGILAELSRVRRTTLAFAPEAGSERLRRVIGKPLDEAALLRTVREAAALGWPSAKLHFMIGLPTETDDDLVAIADLCERVRSEGQRPGARFSVQVTIHPFVPRAQTPFQWEGMLPLEEMRRRIKRLRSLCRRRPLRLRWGHPETAQLEALISRGDRRLADVILGAYRAGARLDGWSELSRPVIWWRACEEAGVDPARALGPRDPGSPLPWSHLMIGEGESHFASEREAGRRGELAAQKPIAALSLSSSPSLSLPPSSSPPPSSLPMPEFGAESVTRGLFAGSPLEPGPKDRSGAPAEHLDESDSSEPETTGAWDSPPGRESAPGRASLYGRGRARRRPGLKASRRYRLRFSKTNPVRFISHLDVVRLLDRSLRRADIGVASC